MTATTSHLSAFACLLALASLLAGGCPSTFEATAEDMGVSGFDVETLAYGEPESASDELGDETLETELDDTAEVDDVLVLIDAVQADKGAVDCARATSKSCSVRAVVYFNSTNRYVNWTLTLNGKTIGSTKTSSSNSGYRSYKRTAVMQLSNISVPDGARIYCQARGINGDWLVGANLPVPKKLSDGSRWVVGQLNRP